MLNKTEKLVHSLILTNYFSPETVLQLSEHFLVRRNDLLTGKYGFSRHWWMIEDGKVKDAYRDFCSSRIDVAERFFTCLIENLE